MRNESLAGYSFIFSIMTHVVVLGALGGVFDISFLEKQNMPQTTHLQIKREKIAPLPAIKVLGQVKQLKSDHRPQTTDHRKSTKSMGDQPLTVEQNIIAQDETLEAMLRYQDMVKQRIESHRSYPAWAVRRKVEGTVDLKFVIFNNGEGRDIEIIHSSGNKILDKEAVQTIKRAMPFLPLPPQIRHDFMTIRVAIVFLLD